MLRRVRESVGRWPGCCETLSFGHPAFKAGPKTFAVLETYRDLLSLCVPAGEDQDLLLGQPGFYRTPYAGHRGWVSLRLEPGTDWRLVEGLLEGAYRRVAGPRKLHAFDAARR